MVRRGLEPFWNFLEFGDRVVDKMKALAGRDEPLAVPPTHAVLGTPMLGPWPAGYKVAVFANGCFWGSEKGIWRLPGGGIYTTAVGYCGGFTKNPRYDEVCSGRTGHTEGVQVVYDPKKISFVDILRWFWEAHDPTQGMGQGHDRGTQYRSGFYWFDDEQKELVERSARAYQEELTRAGINRKITTEMKPASDFDQLFYYAEEYHQQYLAKPGSRPYCSAQPLLIPLPLFDQWAPPALWHHAPKLTKSFWDEHAPTPHCVVRAENEPLVGAPSQVQRAPPPLNPLAPLTPLTP